MSRDFRQNIEGFGEIQREIEVVRKYGVNYLSIRGQVGRLIHQLHPRRILLEVSEIREETATAKTFRLVALDHYLPPFQAGQYINLFVGLEGVRTSRPYSIASPPNQAGYYEIAVRRVEKGFVSNYLLDRTKVGDQFESTGPSGNFFHNPLFHGRELVFVAGGSGVAPFMSMIREITDCGLERRIHLFYGSRRPDDILFREELDDRARRHKNVTVSHIISEPPPGYTGLKGFITGELMKRVTAELSGRTFYLCGPEAMYPFCLAELEKLGVAGTKVRREIFGPPRDVAAQPGWPEGVSPHSWFRVQVRGGKAVPAKAGDPLMISLEKAGVVLPSSCRSGECSLCRTKLVSGRVFQPREVKLRKSDRAFGYIHPCLAYPLGDLEILV